MKARRGVDVQPCRARGVPSLLLTDSGFLPSSPAQVFTSVNEAYTVFAAKELK